ncbi:MAG: DEAD/DEAH box helicase [Lachnospiraceae bacterium]|jgi:ATP-dependent Lhr-like helicase|nr:DEAD/DEAH box helicase [Lachnospiraceae bacterium]
MDVFSRLSPFIQDYIYRSGWETLRDVQVAACEAIFRSPSDLLLSTPTASGKTEAAFLPMITEIHEDVPSSVGILYIAPLKALINDQFLRMEELLEEADIPVTKWHGDVASTQKNKLMRRPRGILQITPESLEAMLMRRMGEVRELFADLRFILIDEVHQFVGEDRGVQLMSILGRIEAAIGHRPRRVGLSATLGDIEAARVWLCGGAACQAGCIAYVDDGTGGRIVAPDGSFDVNRVTHGVPSGRGAVSTSSSRPRARMQVNHFDVLPEEIDPSRESMAAYYDFLYRVTGGKKCIIFANSRMEVEGTIVKLKEIAADRREPDLFLVHHGNISAANRAFAEDMMKNADLPYVVGATVTLELGIDLGGLERIIQIGSPHSVSGLAQRLGRSGRRGNVPEMSFVFAEEQERAVSFYDDINWELRKCVALIELYRGHWTEPVAPERYPYGVLYHQTMSFIYGHSGVTPETLARNILTLPPFSHVTQDDYRKLLRFMLATGQLERTDEGGLILGDKGEALANHYDFFSVFVTPETFSVREGGREIGTVHVAIGVGETFALQGRTWQVAELDADEKIIYVEAVEGEVSNVWKPEYDRMEYTQVLRKMREVLTGDGEYPYLDRQSAQRLTRMRRVFRKALGGSGAGPDIIQAGPDVCMVFPWLGTKGMNALKYALKKACPHAAVDEFASDHIRLYVRGVGSHTLEKAIRAIARAHLAPEGLPIPEKLPPMGKFGEHVPPALWRKQYCDKYVDVGELALFD